MSATSSKKSDYEDESFEEDSTEESISEYEQEISVRLNEENDNSDEFGDEIIPEIPEKQEDETIEDDNEEEEEDINSSVELDFTSNTPSSFNSDDHAFHLNFIQEPFTKSALKNKAGSRKSFSFTNDRMREIERHNRILLQRILTKKPTYKNPFAKKTNTFAAKTNLPPPTRTSSAAVNRKKQQTQIDRENQILKRKIESIACRRSRQLT